MSIFGTLGVGRLGLLAQQQAIQVTSNNIANVNTPGYTRQRPIFTGVSPSFLPDGFPIGGGVEVSQVRRIADAQIEAQLREERSAQGFDTGTEAGLARIEGIFQELAGTGINSALTDFLNAFSDLSTSPDDPTVRQGVVESATTLVDLIRDADRRLEQMQIDANSAIEQSVREINDLARDIADLNRSIFAKEGQGNGAVASQLRDERSQLMEQLAEKIDIQSFERTDGTNAVFVGGGFLLVDAEQAAQLTVRSGAPGNPLFFDVYQTLDGSINGPITTKISGGTIAAQLDLRDSVVPSYRQNLDEFAFTLADRVNTLHFPNPAPVLPAGAFGLIDDTLRRFFIDSSQPPIAAGADFVAVAGAATNIAIHTDILANPRHIAAGTESLGAGVGAASGDGRNARAIADVSIASSAFYVTGDAVGTPTGATSTLGDFFDNVAGRVGAQLQSTRRSLAQEELIVAQLEERRGALSGVSIDEEVANLVRFERAYQASARVIQTANDLLSFLMNI